MKCKCVFREFQKLFFNHQKRKKMKRQILNLEGVAVLTKEQQKVVNGGANGMSVNDVPEKKCFKELGTVVNVKGQSIYGYYIACFYTNGDVRYWDILGHEAFCPPD